MNKIFTNLPSRKLTAILVTSFTASFTIFLFTPLDLYLHNPKDFVMGWKFLLPNLLMFSLLGFIALSVVLLMLLLCRRVVSGLILLLVLGLLVVFARFALHRFLTIDIYLFAAIVLAAILWILLKMLFKEKAADVMLLVMWGGFVIAYAQMLLLNSGMTSITGDNANYGSLTPGHIANLLIWVIVTFLPLCVWMVFRAKKKEFKYEKALVLTMLIIFGMQIAGLVVTDVSTELPRGFDEEPLCFSYEPILTFNPDDNILVFVLDRLDAAYMTDTLERYPELNQQLDGFTFYQDNISEFPSTFPSITNMLTQHYYRDELTFAEYWEEAWSQHNVVDALRENGFSTNMYLDSLSTFGDFNQIENRTNNLRKDIITVNLMNTLNCIGRLSLGRLSPYFLKNYFINPLDSAFGNKFYALSNTDYVQPTAVGNESDMKFYDYIRQNEFTADCKKRVFNFIHLNCSHADWNIHVTTGGYHYDEKSGVISPGGTYMDSTRACFEILNTFFEKMKKIGVYDNSTIILLADHGGRVSELPPSFSSASLLIKTKMSSGTLKIDTECELSNRYLGASILELAGLPYDKLGVSYFDIIDGAVPPARNYYFYRGWWDERNKSRKARLQGIYEVNGNANDPANWKLKED